MIILVQKTHLEPEEAIIPMQVWEVIGAEGGWLEDVQKSIIATFSVSESTARRAIKKAEELSYVINEKKKNPSSNREKTYLTRGKGKDYATPGGF